MKRLGVLGWPVAHSRSPAIQNAALAELGLRDWHYQRLPVPPELLFETTRALGGSGFVGANVTIPHKQAVLALADSALRRRARSAQQTRSRSPRRLDRGGEHGCAGADRSARALAAWLHALVLGAGGSARAVVWALREAGASEVSIWNRTEQRARALAQELGARALARPEPAELLVNCTSVGLEPDPHELDALALDAKALGDYPSSSTSSIAAGARRCCMPRRRMARRQSTASRCSSRRARSASSCGQAARRRCRSCATQHASALSAPASVARRLTQRLSVRRGRAPARR